MLARFIFTVAVIAVAVTLTFAPVFAQDAGPGAPANDTTTANANQDDDGPDLGWLGLLGLVGLGGLMRRDRHDHGHNDRAVNR